MNRRLKYIIILAVCIILSNQLIHLYYLYKEVTTQYRHQQNDIITKAVYEFNMLSTNVAQGDLVSYNTSEKQLIYYIDKKIILKEILKIAGITAAVIALFIASINISRWRR